MSDEVSVLEKSALMFTYEDYCSLNDDKRYELLDGELLLSPAPSEHHQRTCANLFLILRGYIDKYGLGRVYFAPIDVVLSPHDVVQPDILFIASDRGHIITEKNIAGAPDLVVEVLSENTEKRDRGYKKKLYAKHGVKEYWIVDPRKKQIEVYVLSQSGFTLHATCKGKESLSSSLFQKLSFSPEEVF